MEKEVHFEDGKVEETRVHTPIAPIFYFAFFLHLLVQNSV